MSEFSWIRETSIKSISIEDVFHEVESTDKKNCKTSTRKLSCMDTTPWVDGILQEVIVLVGDL